MLFNGNWKLIPKMFKFKIILYEQKYLNTKHLIFLIKVENSKL